jgi:hypothetical protein
MRPQRRQPHKSPRRDPRIPGLVAAIEAQDAGARTNAASALDDLLRGVVNAEDYELIVAGLLQRAAREEDAVALESMLHTLGEAADRPGSGAMADWDPLIGLLKRVQEPECLGLVLTTLGLARHERYRVSITPFLAHAHDGVREAAAGAIAELGSV